MNKPSLAPSTEVLLVISFSDLPLGPAIGQADTQPALGPAIGQADRSGTLSHCSQPVAVLSPGWELKAHTTQSEH